MLCLSSKSKSTNMLPPFNEMGYLPPGIYEVTWTEFSDPKATRSVIALALMLIDKISWQV